jgi:hypothetical protein
MPSEWIELPKPPYPGLRHCLKRRRIRCRTNLGKRLQLSFESKSAIAQMVISMFDQDGLEERWVDEGAGRHFLDRL